VVPSEPVQGGQPVERIFAVPPDPMVGAPIRWSLK
jgi:hypothetical protein